MISLLTDNHLIERIGQNLALITGVFEKETAYGTAVTQHYLLEVNSKPWQGWPGEEDPAAAITPGAAMAAVPDEEVVAAEELTPDQPRLVSTKNSRVTYSSSGSDHPRT